MLKTLKALGKELKRSINKSAKTMILGREINPKAYYLTIAYSGKHWPVDLIPIERWKEARKKAKRRGCEFCSGSTLLRHHEKQRTQFRETLKRFNEERMKKAAEAA